MQRFGFNQYGAATVFETIESEQPQPKENQVLIQVLGVGLNPYDASLRRGNQAAFRKLTFPIIPGMDVVGRVVALGEAVTDYAVGDLVINYRPSGGYSEYVVASTDKIVKKPTALSFVDAAGLPQVGIAAYTIMTKLLQLTPGQTVAVLGASGGVGSMVVQLAKYQKLTVIAVASAKNRLYLRQLGADHALDYQEAAGTDWQGQADAVVDTINGGNQSGLAANLVKPDGVVVTSAFVSPDLNAKTGVTHKQLGADKPAPASEALPYLVEMAKTFGLSVRAAAVLPFSLEGVMEGHQLLESRHEPGKIVLMQPKAVVKPVRKDVNHL